MSWLRRMINKILRRRGVTEKTPVEQVKAAEIEARIEAKAVERQVLAFRRAQVVAGNMSAKQRRYLRYAERCRRRLEALKAKYRPPDPDKMARWEAEMQRALMASA